MHARLVFAFLALVAASAHAQQPVASETIEVRLLEIDVVVTDGEGKPVHGLTPGDFELSENGRVQQVTNLSEYRDVSAGAAGTTAAPPAAERAPTVPGPRMLVLLLDPIPLLGDPRAEFFSSLRGLVERVVRDGDKAQIRQWAHSGFKTIGEPALDRTAALDAIRKLERELAISPSKGPSLQERAAFLQESKQSSRGTDPADRAAVASQIRSEALILSDEDFAEMRRKTASMQRVVSSLRGATGRRTVIVYASSQFPRLGAGHNTAPMIASVIATANANGVAFYAVRPGRLPDNAEEQGLLQNEIEALTPLAVQTGGAVGTGEVGVRAVLERIASDLGSYYSLGWHARSDGSDRQRRVRVRAKNPELVVRARTTLIEKSDRTRAADQLIARLFERGDGGDVEFEVTVGKASGTGRRTTSIPVSLTIPADQLKFVERAGSAAARFTVLAVAGDALGNTTTVTSDTREVAAPARSDAADGNIRYAFEIAAARARSSVSIGVFDENSGLLGVRRIDLSGGEGAVAEIAPVVSDAWWQDASERAVREGKPLVAFFRPKRCKDCDVFEKNVLGHPAIARRMPNVLFASPLAGQKSTLWTSDEPGLAVFDETGEMRAKWTGVPDATQLGMILDATIASASDFKRAAEVARTGLPYAETSDVATGLVKLGRPREARAALDEAVAKAAPADRQMAAITLATLDAREGKFDQALAALGGIIADARTPDVAAQAWLATGFLRVARNETDAARLAFRAAIDAADETSPVRHAARQNLQQLATTQTGQRVVRLLPLSTQIISGPQTVRTAITSAAVARVTFTLDNEQTITTTAPPFSAYLQFTRIPQAQTVRATAYDRAGVELGRDELRVNDGGEVFWVRLTEPQSGDVKGSVPVQVALRTPAARTANRVVISWNERPVATLTSAPWRTAIDIPAEMGVLKAVIELDDGQSAEDAVVLNAGGYTARSEVQMVDLPITVAGNGAVTSSDVEIREGRTRRTIEALTAGVDAPLTVGMLIDSSSSMQKALPDVQEAAIRFVDSLHGTADRAFVVAFDSTARMLEAPTSDRARIRAAILSLRPAGYTALYDAMVLGLLQFEGVKGRRALVVFTDGNDVSSGYGADAVEALARRSNVPIYLVTPPLPQARIPRISTENRAMPGQAGGTARPTELAETRLAKQAARLASVANDSGGELFEFSKIGQVGGAFVKIGESLKAQWILTIRTDAAAKENEWRAIDVSVKNRKVRAPAGYYAPH